MAFTQTDIDKLKIAIASGAKRVRYASGEVEYRSLADMERTLRGMEAEVNPSTRTTRRVAKVVSGF